MKIVKIIHNRYRKERIIEIARELKKGKIIAVPTETVYGLAVNLSNQKALKRLLNIRNSREDKKITILLPNTTHITQYVSDIPFYARKLIKEFMPGPLTLVLNSNKKDSSNTIGIRIPKNDITRELINYAGCMVGAPSANPSNLPPATTVEEVINYFEGKIDYIIDTGQTKYKKSSTVVFVDYDRLYVKRKGVLSLADIRKKFIIKNILFVCTGNTCRSPMAEGIFKRLLSLQLNVSIAQLKKKGYKIHSAGTGGIDNCPATRYAEIAVRRFNVDITSHRSKPLLPKYIEEADVVFVMTKGHLETIKEWAPEYDYKASLLHKDNINITDPIGSSIFVYEDISEIIYKSLKWIIKKLFSFKIVEK